MATRLYNDFPLTPHFWLREFECRCCRRARLATRFVLLLEELRLRWARPIMITSGYRCDERNRTVGGAKNSLHRLGQAADLAANVADQRKLSVIAHALGFDEILPGGAKNYLHLGLKIMTV